jgi:hypothetical protein
MNRVLLLLLIAIGVAIGGCKEHFDPSTITQETLREIIVEQQRTHVRESYGVRAHECFTEADLDQFIADERPSEIAAALRTSKRFMAVVALLKEMPPEQRQSFLNTCRRPLRPTWSQLGRISGEGQTEAGQQAELLIAQAIVDLVIQFVDSRTGPEISELASTENAQVVAATYVLYRCARAVGSREL